MKLIKSLDEFKIFPNSKSRLGLFLCPKCLSTVKKPISHGKRNKTCGCDVKPKEYHKMSKDPLLSLWRGIHRRCYEKSNAKYKRYGGRGIYVSDEWYHSPVGFAKWAKEHGYKKGLQIDRIDNDGPYSVKNCRFVTLKENVRNSSTTKLNKKSAFDILSLKLQGVPNTIIAKYYGITRSAIYRVGVTNWMDVKKDFDCWCN